MFACTCACHELVGTTSVVESVRFNCMIVQIDAHPSKPPANDPICRGAGSYVDLHPHGTAAFRRVLLMLGIKDPRILIPQYGTGPVLT